MKQLLLIVALCSSASAQERIPIIVRLAEHTNVAAIQHPDKHTRRARIVQALQVRAKNTQVALHRLLRGHGATHVQPLWIINGVAATVTPATVRAIRKLPGVVSVTADSTMHAPIGMRAATSRPEWNLMAVRAHVLWNLGFDGAGTVVANMDSGVDVNHPDLHAKWRGGADSWWDPYRNTTAPYDIIGHGTQTMGIMLGGNAGGSFIGVAPGAQWIAAKIYDDRGNTTVSVVHQAFQWLLAPSGIPGAPDAPDVVNASFGLAAVNACDTTFQTDFEALRSAGIVVVFAAGNSGPNPWTSLSPANNPDGFSVGAVDQSHAIAYFSSRGASSCTNGIYPDTVAPGVNVRTSDISFAGIPQYTYVTGTSFSAPHVAGVAALLAGAFPNAAAADIERALRSTAVDLGPTGPDQDYGYGLVDAYGAYAAMAAQAPLDFFTTSLPKGESNR